jgi:hypothetical protein
MVRPWLNTHSMDMDGFFFGPLVVSHPEAVVARLNGPAYLLLRFLHNSPVLG